MKQVYRNNTYTLSKEFITTYKKYYQSYTLVCDHVGVVGVEGVVTSSALELLKLWSCLPSFFHPDSTDLGCNHRNTRQPMMS